MTNETQRIMDKKELRMLLDLSEGKVPYEEVFDCSKNVLGNSVPVYLEDIVIDTKGWRKNQEVAVSNRFIEKTNISDEYRVYPASMYVKEGQLRVSNCFNEYLSEEDLVSAARAISVPTNKRKRLRCSIFGTASFPEEIKVKGYTLGAAEKKCFEYEGRLFPQSLGLFDYSLEALETWRKKIVDERAALLEKSVEFMKQIPKKQVYDSLKELLEKARLSWDFGSTQAYEGMPASVDSEKRILLPLYHFDATKCLHDESRIVGNIIVSPILRSTGEIVTPKIIDKYLN